MKKIQCLLSILLVCCMVIGMLPITAHASTAVPAGDNLEWNFSEDGVLTISGSGPMNDFDYYDSSYWRYAPWHSATDIYYGPAPIQEKIKKIVIEDGVTSIGRLAFYECKNLTEVSIPGSVETIGGDAFVACTSLVEIEIPEGVVNLDTNNSFGLFWCCYKLETVKIPSTVTNMWDDDFYSYNSFTNCTNLKSIEVDDRNMNYCSYQGMLFTKDMTTLLQCPFAMTGTVTIPEGVVTVDPHAFSSTLTGCACTRIEFPSSVIGFGIESADAADGMMSGGMFSKCSNLMEFRVDPLNPNYCSDNGLLMDKDQTILIRYPGGLKGSFTIPNGITKIGRNAFSCCDLLTEVIIPSGVTEIGSHAFAFCTSLKTVTIPASVSKVGFSAFYESDNITDVYYEGSKDQWRSIQDSYGNELTPNATIHYNSTGPEGPGISLDKSSIRLTNIGDTETLIATAQPTDAMVTWSTSDSDVATVDNGVVTAVGVGSATISASISVGNETLYLVCTVTVKYIPDGEFNYYDAFMSGEKGTYTYTYDEAWFNTASTTYQHDLTRMSIRMAAAGFGNNTGNEDASLNIQTLMKNLGFENIKASYPAPERNSIGYIIGSKNIRTEDGREYSLINVTIRGGGYGAEWGGNFQVGTGTDHDGWTLAKKEVIAGIEAYMKEHGSMLFPNQKVWIQGYSRGSAVANLVAKELDLGNVKGITAPMQNIYAFGFEVPQATRANDKGDDGRYGNIVNIANPIDLVTKVVPSGFDGYGRYGKTYYLPYQAGNEDYAGLHQKMLIELNKIAAMSGKSNEVDSRFDAPAGMAARLDALANDLSAAFLFSPMVYTIRAQSALIAVVANTLGGGNESVSAVAALQTVFGVPYLLAHYNGVIPGSILGAALSCIDDTEFTFHYPELCMAWLDSMDGEMFIDNSHLIYRRVFINCPVNVSVYDTTGALVGKFVNGESIEQANSSIYAYIDENDQMVLILPVDEEYRIEMTATDSGTVTYTVTEYNMEDAGNERVVSYYEVEVNQGDELIGTVENLDKEPANYPLTLNGDEQEADVDQSGDMVAEYTVTVSASGNGEAVGGGIYASGEFAKVNASAATGKTFLGWYVDGKLVSSNAEYRFLVDKNITVVAQFTKDTMPSAPGYNPGSTYVPPTYTITTPSVTGGKISVSPASASPGSTVTITTTPDSGYVLAALIVSDANGRTIDLTDKGNGQYSFKMPNGRVSIDAEFKPISIDVPWNNPFSDVSIRDWYYDAVKFVNQNGLMNGIGNSLFAPNTQLSRAMLAEILYNKEGRPTVISGSTFEDVQPGLWYADAVAWASGKGVAAGYGNGLFGPDDDITREQIAVILYRYAGTPTPPNLLLDFSDADKVSAWAQDAVHWAVSQGILSGKGDGILDPTGKATRAEVAQMLKNCLEK